MRFVVACSVVITAATTTAAGASPEVSLDDPVYDELARLDALRQIVPYEGGVAPLTEARIRELLGMPRRPSTWWLRPLARATATASAYDEDDRPYSTGVRPRDLVGTVALSCERQLGRSCGGGAGFSTELDSAAGYGDIAAAYFRLRATTGTHGYADDLTIDRAYASAEAGAMLVTAGRDVIAIGPRGHTSSEWSDHAAPLDQMRVQTARPYPLAPHVRGSAIYMVGQLRDPAQVHPPLVTISRVQADIYDRIELGLHQELALGGDGIPSYDIVDFLAEHVGRRDASASASDSSNRRFGGDIAIRVRGARVYYSVTFEDMRKHVLDAIRHDADHVLGAELAALGGNHALVIELARTGARSYEHLPQVTQFVNAGRVIGAPLGPDAASVFAGAHLAVGNATVMPWLELARLASDRYVFVPHGPITLDRAGTAELRYRIGARERVPLAPELAVTGEASYEHVSHYAFDPAASRDQLGLRIAVVWQPRGRW